MSWCAYCEVDGKRLEAQVKRLRSENRELKRRLKAWVEAALRPERVGKEEGGG